MPITTYDRLWIAVMKTKKISGLKRINVLLSTDQACYYLNTVAMKYSSIYFVITSMGSLN